MPVVAILLVDLVLDIYVLAYGDGGTTIHKMMLRFFDVSSLLRVLRGIRLLKVINIGSFLLIRFNGKKCLLQLVFPVMGKVMDSLVTHRLMHGFDIGKAFIIGQEEANKLVKNLVQNDLALSQLNYSAQESRATISQDLGKIFFDISATITKSEIRPAYNFVNRIYCTTASIQALALKTDASYKNYKNWFQLSYQLLVTCSMSPKFSWTRRSRISG